MGWWKDRPTLIVLATLIVTVIGLFVAPIMDAELKGTELRGLPGIWSFWVNLFSSPIPLWAVLVFLGLALITGSAYFRWSRTGGSNRADLRIVPLSTPQARWSIGAMGNVPHVALFFHARLAHTSGFSVEIVKAHLEGTECVAPFLPIIISGPYDESQTNSFRSKANCRKRR